MSSPAMRKLNNQYENLPVFKSKVDPVSKTFIWDVMGIGKIRSQNLWSAASVEFQISNFSWHLSLGLSENGKVLRATPELLSPENVIVPYSMKIRAFVDALNNNANSSQSTCENVVLAANGTKRCVMNNNGEGTKKWEVLRLDQGIIDRFDSLIVNDTLRLLVTMTVYVNVPA